MKKIRIFLIMLITVVAGVISTGEPVSALAGGDHFAIHQNDVYVLESDLDKVTLKDVLVATGYEVGYSLTGNEKGYLTLSSSDPVELETILDEVSVNTDDWNAFVSGRVGHYSVRVTHSSKALLNYTGADYSNEAVLESSLNLNIVRQGVTSYNPDTETSAAVAIHVANFSVELDTAASFKASTVASTTESELKVWDSAIVDVPYLNLIPGQDLSSKIVYNSNDILAINEAKKSGGYKVRSEVAHYLDIKQTKEFYVYLKNDNTVVNKNSTDLAVFADDFKISESQAKTMTNSEFESQANLQAFYYVKGEKLGSNFRYDLSELKSTTKTKVVTVPFTYEDTLGQTISSKVNVSIEATIVKPTTPVQPVEKGKEVTFKPSIANNGGPVSTGDDSNVLHYGVILGFAALAIIKLVRKEIKK